MPSEPTPASAASSVDFEKVGSEYFQQRELKKGAAGWVLLVGLGVAYVISGDYAGWNFGLAQGGWGAWRVLHEPQRARAQHGVYLGGVRVFRHQ